MKRKFERFDELPKELELETAHHLSTRDVVNLARTSTYHLALFKPMIAVRQLLHHVTRGQHDVVKAMLKQDMSLIFKRGPVTDCSGREFANISGFEYALWALDKHLWAAMIACIPCNEEGKKVFAKLIAQYNTVNIFGITYRLDGKTITETHFDFENTLIKELQTHMDLMNAPGAKNWEALDMQWREGVGGAQKLVPMHVVDEFCSNELFYPVPKFNSQPKSSKQFYNWTTDKGENWFNSDSKFKLSVDFAIYKVDDSGGASAAACVCWGPLARTVDLDAMTALCKVRTNDFIILKSQLEAQMTQNNHHQVSRI